MSTFAVKNGDSGRRMLRAAWRASLPGLLVVVALTVFVSVLKLTVPLYIFQIFDRVLTSRNIDTLVMLTIPALMGIGAAAIGETIRGRILIHWGAWIERSWAKRLFLAGIASEEQRRPERLLKDLSTIRTFVSGSGLAVWLDVFWAPVLVAIVYLIHPALALISAAAIALVILVSGLGNAASRSARQDASDASSKTSTILAAVERCGEAIWSLKMSRQVAERWSEDHTERRDGNFRERTINTSTTGILKFCESATRVFGYAIGVWLVLQGEITIGGVIAGTVLGRMAVSLVRRAASKTTALRNVMSAYRRAKQAVIKSSNVERPVLQTKRRLQLVVDDIGYRYPNQDTQVLRKISLTADPGELVNIRGPSGAGKSTFAKIIIGAISPRSGAVRLGDVDISRFHDEDLGPYIGYLPQDARLFPGTIAENISRMSESDIDDVKTSAKLVGIHDAIIRLPEGYDTRVDENDVPLSGGQRKMVALARAFHGSPPLLVLDEPEENLDSDGRSHLENAIDLFKAIGSIVIVTSQSRGFSDIADKTIRLGTPSKSNLIDVKKTKSARSFKGDAPAETKAVAASGKN